MSAPCSPNEFDDRRREAEVLRAHVDEVCGSEAFVRAPGASRLLRYLVDATLAGRAVKEWDLGWDVFARGADYDPKQDSIVRTEATRLRARLKRYYEGEGKAAMVRLELPAGRYVLRVTPVSAPARGPRRWQAWMVGGLALLRATVLTGASRLRRLRRG